MESGDVVTIKDLENLSEEEMNALVDAEIALVPVIESIVEAHFYNGCSEEIFEGAYPVFYVESGLICLGSCFGHGKEDKILCKEAIVF